MSTLNRDARRAGLIYLVMSVLGAPTLIYLPRLIVTGDAAATAHNVLGNEPTYRLLLGGALVGWALYMVLGWALHDLFARVDEAQATLLRIFVVASAIVGVIDVALLAAPLVALKSTALAAAFTRPQVEALALTLFGIRSVELHANEAFWGFWLIPFGILVLKSRYIPRIIGVLLLIASVGYIIMSFAYIAFPSLLEAASRIGGLLIQGELAVILWLVIMGAKDPRESRAGYLGAR